MWPNWNVLGLKPQESEQNEQKAVEAELEKASQMIEMERLKMRIKMLEDQLMTKKEQIEDLKEQRDHGKTSTANTDHKPVQPKQPKS